MNIINVCGRLPLRASSAEELQNLFKTTSPHDSHSFGALLSSPPKHILSELAVLRGLTNHKPTDNVEAILSEYLNKTSVLLRRM
jgi:hypothetical protein